MDVVAMSIEDTLLAFGEWLDGEGVVKSEEQSDNDKTYEQLATEFVKWWNDPDIRRTPLAGTVPVRFPAHDEYGEVVVVELVGKTFRVRQPQMHEVQV